MSKPAYTFESSDSDDDSSAAPERDLKYAMSFRIKYGKAYKGKCLQDVVATPRGRKYLKWSLDEFDNLHPAAKKNITIVLEYYASTKKAKAAAPSEGE